MKNQIDPNSNHYNKDTMINEEEEKKEEENIPGYDDTEIEETSTSTTQTKNIKEQYRSKMIKMFGLVIIIFIVVILIGFIISLLNKKNYSYADVEEEMKQAAIAYFEDNEKKLPSTSGLTVEIHDNVLSANEYMKPLEEYLKKDSCTGKVIVEKIDSKDYSYTSYLDCGEDYQTKELYKAIIDKDRLVTTGYGLYAMNGEYIYRGKDVNNYVKFKNSDYLWRIVKVTSNNEIVLVQNERTENTYAWDTRYNSVEQENTGINVYNNSNMSTVLKVLAKGYFGKEDDESDAEEYAQFAEEIDIYDDIDKSKLKKYKACVGPRSASDTSRNGSSECAVTAETKVGLLTVSDFLNASIDPGCKTTVSPECQNYNYLTNTYNYWLANGDSENSSKVYRVSASNYINSREAASGVFVRMVVHVGEDAMIEKGKGTKNNPYVIR